jgi:hypothetical protein
MKTNYSFVKLILSLAMFLSFIVLTNVANAQCSVTLGNDTTIYRGYSPLSCVTLTANATGTPSFSYLWSNGATTQSITVCDTVTATYWVSVTDANLCVSSDTVVVNVVDVRCGPHNTKVSVCHVPPGDPLNAHTICVKPSAVPAHLAHGDYLGNCIPTCFVDLGNDTTVCGNYTLTAGTGYISYVWSDNSTDDTLNVSIGGMYWVVVIDSANCTATDSVFVTIFPAPTASAGNDTTIVPPDCATLFGSASSGTPPYSFLWSNGDTTQTTTVCDTVTTIYTLTVVDANGCSSTSTVTVTVQQPCSINLGNDTTLCSVEAPFLIDAGSGYASYLWSNSSTGQSISVLVSGTYWVQVTDTANCVASDTINVTINPSPFASAGNDTTVTEPDCASLFGVASGGTPPYSYLWSSGDTIPNIVPCNTPGSYTYILVVTDSNGCTASDSVIVTVLPMAIFIDPNPNSENAKMWFFVPQDGPASIELYDISGNRLAVLFRQNVKANVHYSLDFNSGALLPGIYFVRLVSDGQYYMHKKMIVIR